jgi:DNA recombination protein RmuC
MAILEITLLGLILLLSIAGFIRNGKKGDNTELFTEFLNKMEAFDRNLLKLEGSLKDDFRINREENAGIAKENRLELGQSLKEFKTEMSDTLKHITEQNRNVLEKLNLTLEEKLEKINLQVQEKLKELAVQARADNLEMRDSLVKSSKDFQESFDKNVKSFNDLQREKFSQMEGKQTELISNTDRKLEEMRITVDEKLHKTLNERLGQSFETVSKQLLAVQDGLGEMKTLAQDVGGLKKVLGNVKMRGGIGEVQLAMLLEQVLAPEQYEANVKTKQGSSELVEFAIKLPGRDDTNKSVYLPVDAKFPKDIYEQLTDAYETADISLIETAGKNMESVIKKMAKDIRDKYIDPPNTTDFAIMFLPFEGIYAEVVRRASLLEQLQREYKVIVTGPTTLAAILNSLQMGFRTLALQKRSSEVWEVLGAVKNEFEKCKRSY